MLVVIDNNDALPTGNLAGKADDGHVVSVATVLGEPIASRDGSLTVTNNITELRRFWLAIA